MKRFAALLSLLLLASFAADAGKLEDFEREYQFLRKNWNIYNGKKKKNNRDKEIFLFRNRIGQAGDMAFEIQLSATKCGIKGITIGEDYRQAVSYLRIMGGKVTKDNSGLCSAALKRIDSQLAMLKQLKFSVEEGTFSKQEYSGTSGMDALVLLEKMMDKMVRQSNRNTFVSTAYLAELKKTSFEDFRNLAEEIVQTAKKKKLSRAYDLREHALVFLQDLEAVYNIRRKQKTRHRGKERENNQVIDPNLLKTAVKKLKFDIGLIHQDTDALRRSGFSMEKIKQVPYDAARSSDESIVPGTGGEGTSISAVSEEKGTVAELDAMKEKAYRSESRMNGVSESYYSNYRTLLTPRQADEMDREYRKAVDQGYPEPLARANAVRKIHGKYTGRTDAYTKEELKYIFRKQRQ